LKRADIVLAVSQSTADDAIRHAGVEPGRIKVIYEAADSIFKPEPGAADRVKQRFDLAPGYLLFVGALDARKDPAALLRAWSVAKEANPGLVLVLVGDPGQQAPFRMPG